MKQQTITVDVFKEGDYVRTPRGVGIILISNFYYYKGTLHYTVLVQHKFDCSDNPNNEPESMSGWMPMLISKEEYDGGSNGNN